MMGKLLRVELMKIKRKGFWFLTFLGPIGVVALQVVNYSVRWDYLKTLSDDDWLFYLQNVSGFTPLALVLGIAILTSFMASIENETNAWKQLLALPVRKTHVYLAKFTVLAGLLFLASILLCVATLAYGLTLDFGSGVPVFELLEYSFFPFFASLPILALQLWVAMVSENQGLPITAGVLNVILTYSAYSLPDWAIWKWTTLMNAWQEPLYNGLMGLAVGLVIYMVGMMDFVRRDVK
jgi:hypothetical protein